jgi:hypothetical protein
LLPKFIINRITSKPPYYNLYLFSEKIDLWGVGTILYYSLFGKKPFPQTG